MPKLIHLIYCSTASQKISRKDLADLLAASRSYNEKHGVTGMLLYSEGSFFQVLEGEPPTVDNLYAAISKDKRHKEIVTIIREPIPRRSFGDWTMGYADITPQELDTIAGANDFFTKGESFVNIGAGRAKKLLLAFKMGRWRSALSDTAYPSVAHTQPSVSFKSYSHAYQPIIHAPTNSIFTYEALIRGRDNEPAWTVLQQVDPSERQLFEAECCNAAVTLASRMGLSTRLNLNYSPSTLQSSKSVLKSLLTTALQCQILTEQIVVEILEKEIVQAFEDFRIALNSYRGSGLAFAIDDFGAGYAGLNLLAEFQPDFVKLDMNLVRGIESNGPRQAIVRGIQRTCLDLGIDIIAEGVETAEEYAWFRSNGIEFFQGFLLAKPAFEQLPSTFFLPK